MGAVADVTITSPTGAEAPTPDTGRPDNVPEKFWNAETKSVNTEALLASYAHLESKLGAGSKTAEEVESAAPTTTDEASEEPAEGDDPEADKAREVAEEAGLDIPSLEAHWEEHGTLPEDTYTKLASVGVDKALVDEFVAYRVSQGAVIRAEMLGAVGGEEAVNKMTEWAGQNWNKDQIDAFNDAANSKSRGRIEQALKALKADYDKAKGVAPKLLKPTTTQTKGGAYGSLEELLRDQAKPEYRSDPAFRQAVIEKLSRSKI